MDHFVWDSGPEIFRLGPLSIRYYGLLFALGFLVGYQIMKRIFLSEGKKEEDLSSLLMHLMLGTIIGARLGHCLFYEPAYYLSNPLEILKIWKGGLASHGGSIGVLFSTWLYVRKHPDQPYLWLADRLTLGVSFTAACIRLGNFFNSEILGKPSELPWAVIFARIDNVARHPAMLYESASYLCLFVVLMLIYKKTQGKVTSGRLLGIMLAWIFSSRILIEFVKENQVDFESGMLLNMGQILSIPFVLVGILLMLGTLQKKLPTSFSQPVVKAEAKKRKKKK